MGVWLYKQTNEDRITQLMNQNAASGYTKFAKKMYQICSEIQNIKNKLIKKKEKNKALQILISLKKIQIIFYQKSKTSV